MRANFVKPSVSEGKVTTGGLLWEQGNERGVIWSILKSLFLNIYPLLGFLLCL